MACRLFGAKSLSKPMLCCCQLDPYDQTSMKFYSKYKTFHSWKSIWKYRLRNGVHFVLGEMSSNVCVVHSMISCYFGKVCSMSCILMYEFILSYVTKFIWQYYGVKYIRYELFGYLNHMCLSQSVVDVRVLLGRILETYHLSNAARLTEIRIKGFRRYILCTGVEFLCVYESYGSFFFCIAETSVVKFCFRFDRINAKEYIKWHK